MDRQTAIHSWRYSKAHGYSRRPAFQCASSGGSGCCRTGPLCCRQPKSGRAMLQLSHTAWAGVSAGWCSSRPAVFGVGPSAQESQRARGGVVSRCAPLLSVRAPHSSSSCRYVCMHACMPACSCQTARWLVLASRKLPLNAALIEYLHVDEHAGCLHKQGQSQRRHPSRSWSTVGKAKDFDATTLPSFLACFLALEPSRESTTLVQAFNLQ